MVRFRALLAYDGTPFRGFQVQADGLPTVQGAVEAALQKLTAHPVRITGAGRTDTGVHATGQVIAFEIEWFHSVDVLQRALNAHLPDGIGVQRIDIAPGFHPRFDALSRTYCYQVMASHVRQPLLFRRAWQVRSRLEERAMHDAAAILMGEHDFAAFGKPPQGSNTIRRVDESRWHWQDRAPGLPDASDGHDDSVDGIGSVDRIREGRIVLAQPALRWGTYTVTATAFLQHMVRRMVGAMVDVGRGSLSLEAFAAMVQQPDGIMVRTIAPPHGLTLVEVAYAADPAIRRSLHDESDDLDSDE